MMLELYCRISSQDQSPVALAKKERIPNADQIVIATNFLYENYKSLSSGAKREDGDTDGIRGDLALELLRKALDNGVQVVACDGGSSTDFLFALEKFSNKGLTVVNSNIQGRAPQRRSAFETAVSLPNGKVIIYTQAEKVPLIDNIVEISKPILDGRADIVIPKRNQNLFKESYPDYMWQSEIRVNATYDWLLKRAKLMKPEESFDWFFGPVVFKNDPEIVTMFLKKYRVEGSIRSRIGAVADPEKNSGSHYFPIIEALFKGKRVVSVEVPFIYPETQRKNELSEEKVADFRQRRQLDGAAYRLEAIHFLAYLKEDKRSRIR